MLLCYSFTKKKKYYAPLDTVFHFSFPQSLSCIAIRVLHWHTDNRQNITTTSTTTTTTTKNDEKNETENFHLSRNLSVFSNIVYKHLKMIYLYKTLCNLFATHSH